MSETASTDRPAQLPDAEVIARTSAGSSPPAPDPAVCPASTSPTSSKSVESP